MKLHLLFFGFDENILHRNN